MPDDRKQKLIQLGSDSLADALLDIAKHNDLIDDIINRMIATPKENISQYKKKLSSLKRSNKFIGWDQSSAFAEELSLLLEDLEAGSPDPCTGVELVAAFFEADDSVYGRCDDSNGSTGDVYVIEAKELFVKYASSCADKEKITSILMKLCQNDDYGVRSSLMDSVGLFLDEPMIRKMIDELQILAAEAQKDYTKNSYLYIIGSFAKQIKDAKLFENTRLAIHGESPPTIIEIAQVYLECDEVETSYAWIQKVPEGRSRLRPEYTKTLTEIYTRQGDIESLSALLRKRLRTLPCMDYLQELLDAIGEENREAVITEEIEYMFNETSLQQSNLSFLLDCKKYDVAETYLFASGDQLDGSRYETLLPIGKTFEMQKSFLAASLVYRSLLDSILGKGYTKSYPYGVRYLKKLDMYAPLIQDWKTFPDHSAYKETLVQNHGLKRSFWGQYATK